MAQWEEVAQGVNIWDLQSTVGEMELPKGSKVKVVMDLKLPLGWFFDAAGAEWIFKPFIPDGMELIDVYGEGNQGIVEMEADPAWLLAILAFIKANWLTLIIAGVFLTAIIASIIILVKLAVAPSTPTLLIAGGLGVLALIVILGMRKAPT